MLPLPFPAEAPQAGCNRVLVCELQLSSMVISAVSSGRSLSWEHYTLLGGSCVVISRVISRVVTILITHIRGLITPLIITHEPPTSRLKIVA